MIDSEIKKSVNTLPKDVDPNDASVYKPLASPRVSYNKLDNALKEYYSNS